MVYEAFLAQGGEARRVLLEDDRELKADDLLTYESKTYVILSVEQRQDEIAAVVFAEYVGEVGPPDPV
jgi:hypothetical protein